MISPRLSSGPVLTTAQAALNAGVVDVTGLTAIGLAGAHGGVEDEGGIFSLVDLLQADDIKVATSC